MIGPVVYTLVSPELLKLDFGRRMVLIDEPKDFS